MANYNDTDNASQHLDNRSFNTQFQIYENLIYESDGATLRAATSPLCAMKITEVGDTVYIAKAPIGTAQATAGWQVKRIDTIGANTTFTWADGNADYDNVATDLTALIYS